MSAGYVYVLAFTNGTVKVGRTQDTGQRLNAHKSAGRKFGLTVTDQWLSPSHAQWHENEEALKKIAADLGGVAQSKEYFSGVDFAAVVEKARELPFTVAEGVTGRIVRQVPPSLAGPITPRERAIRLADLEARVLQAETAAKALRMELIVAELASGLLDEGVSAATARKWAAANPADPCQVLLAAANAMEVQVREEAEIEKRLGGAQADMTQTARVLAGTRWA